MATFVIVHGAWSGAHAWRWVRPLLRTAGHEVVTPSLTGLGERAHLATPETDLDVHIADVVAVLHYEDLTDVVLVGHSYGGMVITGVADRTPERIGQLVYLDADVPRAGESMLDLVPAESRALYEESARTRGDGWRVPAPLPDPLPPDIPSEVAWAVARMVHHPLATMTQPLHLEHGETELPRTFVLCTEEKEGEAEPPSVTRVRTDPSWRLVELAASHTAHVAAPALLSSTLLKIAAG
ncbi:alpha/beta hydrolase [Blastococcus sp. CT_GayMR19]|jgi:pimeloyl-ACP methyl ester carboxylesterase|uniref:alpha/beta hydrolase n=1 Tax=Blastococcus sp. CT_GayMR19 TaxID=2559608 RepID=UPI0010743D98|nr:alpha/beta hydrolase [Blastococcus sp. CT_GayMR19]TFV71927.1 alpha/beta hydrolase [Blastococcus sp. CT_GayMR19]